MDRTLTFLLLVLIIQSTGCMRRAEAVKQCANTVRSRQQLPVTFYVDYSTIDKETDAAIVRAADDWNNAVGAIIVRIKGDSLSSAMNLDGWNNITRGTTRPEQHAFTRAYFLNDHIVDTDIILSLTTKADIESIMVHEIGHSLGLAHNENFHSVMRPSLSIYETRRTPSEEDVNAINCLYN